MSYSQIDLHKKKSGVLVVHCSDPRFQKAYRKLIDDLGEYYDLLVMPGACKAIAENQLVVDNIVMLHGLHHFSSIHIFDHVECGAFGSVDNEVIAHKKMIAKAEKALNKVLPDVKVVGHLVGQKAEISLV